MMLNMTFFTVRPEFLVLCYSLLPIVPFPKCVISGSGIEQTEARKMFLLTKQSRTQDKLEFLI